MRFELRFVIINVTALLVSFAAPWLANGSSAYAQTSSCTEVRFTDNDTKVAIIAPRTGSYAAAADEYQKSHYPNSVVIEKEIYIPPPEGDSYEVEAEKIWLSQPDLVIVCSDVSKLLLKALTANH